MFFLFDNAFVSDPKQAREIDVNDKSQVEFFLSNPVQVQDEDEKRQAPAICGARYWPEAANREKENVQHVECLVLDVDAQPVSEQEMLETLQGIRAIVYSSPRHTTATPRWRVILPLLSPLPPKKHRPLVKLLSDGLFPNHQGAINVESTGDPCRLGFVGATYYPDEYRWFDLPGSCFDWTALDLQDEVWTDATKLGGLERSTLWSPRDVALRKCLKKYDGIGSGYKSGDGRSKLLWDVALTVWWAWAAEDENFVLEAMRHVNNQFVDPEEEDELDRQMREAHKRTVGERRQPQGNGTYGWAREPENLINFSTIQDHARRIKRKQSATAETALVAEALKRLAKGETLSDDIEAWRGLITKCAHELAKAFPAESADRITAQFAPSLAVMRRTGKADVPSEGEVYAYVLTRLQSVQRQIVDKAERKQQRVERTIEAATYGERDKPYSREELEVWRHSVGLRDHNWLIVSGANVHVFSNGTWIGPFNEKLEFEAQGRKALLAAQENGGVRSTIFSEDDGVVVPIPLKELVNTYGCVANIRVDMQCERSYFIPDENTLVLSGPQRRPLEPKYHRDVDQWLLFLSGRGGVASQAQAAKWQVNDEYDALCDWLACLPEVQYPVKALYIEGPKRIGKGLFADGIARIWKAGHISLDSAFRHFNNQLMGTPLVLTDEGLSPEMQKFAGDVLRRGLAARSHELTLKRKDSTTIHGCLRLLFTANNLDIFRMIKQKFKREDVEALADRFVHIDGHTDARDFLKQLGHKHRDFVEKNMLAEHALWLHDKRWSHIVERDERFLVLSPKSVVAEVVATSIESTDLACQAICDAVFDKAKTNWLLIKDKRIYVQARELTTFLRIQDARSSLTPGTVSRSLSSIANGPSKTVWFGKKPARVWEISEDSLRAWCGTNGVYEWSDIQAVLEGLDVPAQQL